jgi:hypothetical protein
MNVNANGRFQGALRAGPYKLMVDMMRKASEYISAVPPGSRDYAYSLYNVEEDPGERVNLAANLTEVVKKMAAKVRQFISPKSLLRRVHTEWQWRVSGVRSIMMVKSAQPGEGGRCPSSSFHSINPSRAKLLCMLQLRGQIHSHLFLLYPQYVLCGLLF